MTASRKGALAPLVALLLAACASAGPGLGEAPLPDPAESPAGLEPGQVRWEIRTREEADLWYHALALTGFGARADIPIYDPRYAASISAARRRAGVAPTTLERDADQFRQRFAADERYATLQFLPLYFGDTGAGLIASMNAWLQAGGDPRRVRDAGLQRRVAFLAEQLPTERHRETMAAWLRALEEERGVFLRGERSRLAPSNATVQAVQREWDVLAPSFRQVLDYLMLNRGSLILSPALGSEGRTVALARRDHVIATLVPPSDRPREAIWAALHEMLYPFVQPIIEDRIAPAELRTLDRELLARRAAIRAGALLMDRVAPQYAGEYREAYLVWARGAVPSTAGGRDRAFVEEFPLPDGLAAALDAELETAQQGF